MASKLINNAVFGSAIVLAAVVGTCALPRIAKNPALLFAAGQLQMASGNTAGGLGLINRAAQVSSPNASSPDKPSPIKQSTECKFSPRTAPTKALARVNTGGSIPAPRNSMFQTVSLPPGFDPVSMPSFRIPTSAEIDRQVRAIRLRTNRSMPRQKIAKAAELQAMVFKFQNKAFARERNALEQVQSLDTTMP